MALANPTDHYRATISCDHATRYESGATPPWSNEPFTRADWADLHGVHSTLIPYSYLGSKNPIRIYCTLANYLPDLAAYKRRVSTSRLTTILDLETKYPLGDALLLHGWWCGGTRPSSGPYYYNPAYVHAYGPDELPGETVQIRLLYRAAAFNVPPSRIARIFGAPHARIADNDRTYLANCTRDAAKSLNVSWAAERRRGRTTMQRTMKTLRAWGYPNSTIAHAFNVGMSTVSEHVSAIPDYHPPEDPCYAHLTDAPDARECATEGCPARLMRTSRGTVSLPHAPDEGPAYCHRCACARRDGQLDLDAYRPNDRPVYRPPEIDTLPTAASPRLPTQTLETEAD